jgi:cytochrome oxidase assembly protein ShyY1
MTVLRRLPLIPTMLVAAAVVTMIALGIWQIDRARQKDDLIALYRANLAKPAMSFPDLGPVPRDAMFRPSSVTCIEVVGWRTEGGRSADGVSGSRYIAECRTGADGPGALIELGVSQDPGIKPRWPGGVASGMITTEPDHTSVIARLFGGGTVLGPMLVADRPASGLRASARPSPDTVPNNHVSYAVQWFLFAAAALVIYVLALRKRLKDQDSR